MNAHQAGAAENEFLINRPKRTRPISSNVFNLKNLSSYPRALSLESLLPNQLTGLDHPRSSEGIVQLA